MGRTRGAIALFGSEKPGSVCADEDWNVEEIVLSLTCFSPISDMAIV
jgi:hypothetical protein